MDFNCDLETMESFSPGLDTESSSKMPEPNFVSLPWLNLKELKSDGVLNVMIRAAPESIPCFFGYKGYGDIEVSPGIEDCRQICALLRRVLETNAGDVQPSQQTLHSLLTHRFKNLDGGADAGFLISRKQESVEITVERSDEGDFGFRISLEDVRNLLNFLESALEFSVCFPHK